MSDAPLLMEKDGQIGWLVFNRPDKRNAVGVETWQLMPDYAKDLSADPDIRVVILRGAGDKAFVAGADISQFKDRRRNMEDEEEYRRIGARGREALASLQKPLLAMIHGYCVGGGVGIAIGCDIRIASDDARFGIPAARMGLGYRVSATKNLVDIVGPARTREILITAKQYAAQEALAMGLVHRVVPAAELDAATHEMLAGIAANAPLTQAAAKFIVRELLKANGGLDETACKAAVQRCFDSEDYKEGRRAFMEKRKPAFKGK